MAISSSLQRMLTADRGRASFVLRASLVAIVPSLLIFGVLVALGIETLRPPTGALDAAFIGYSVLLAPVIETAIMLAFAAVLARLIPRQAGLQIAMLALLAALAHRIGGNWRQVADTAWPILVYAASLVVWLRRSAGDAFIVTAAVHALYNAAFFAVGILGPLALHEG